MGARAPFGRYAFLSIMKPAGSTSARALFLAVALFGACRSHDPAPAPASTEAPPDAAAPASSAPPATPRDRACDLRVPVWEEGKHTRDVCEDDAAREGLTVVELSDAWAPAPFDEAPELGAKGKQPFRATFVALENERFGDGPEFDRAKSDRYLELFGVSPSFGVIAARLADEARHACHRAIDDAPLARLDKVLSPWRDRERLRGEVAHVGKLVQMLEWERHRLKLGSLDALREDPRYQSAFKDLDRSRADVEAVSVVQKHLRCDGLLGPKATDGVLDMVTTDALGRFQRKHMLVAFELDAETRGALLTTSDELDLRAALRSLRERVVAATGVVEDGTAREEPGEIVGRVLDAEAFRRKHPDGPMENGAPDLLARATDAAARALGWTSPAGARAFFAGVGEGATTALKVALRLPPPPAYHGPKMDLWVEIDRGDVVYDYPYTRQGLSKIPPVARRPTFVLWARDGDKDVALVRWPTTIGGWKPERKGPKHIEMVYKESPPGPRVWRDMIVTPVWVPPDSAPKRELLRPRPDGSWAPNTDLFGPGYASAFGLLKMVNARKNGGLFLDDGIGTHGSVSYDSINAGTSHGCHRLHNHRALRLGTFLLAHREHVARGVVPLAFGRSFAWQGKPMKLAFETGGYRIEMTPPVPIEVLPGRILGHATSAVGPKPLPDNLQKQLAQELWE